MPTLLRIFSKFLFYSSHHLVHAPAILFARRKYKFYPILMLPAPSEFILILPFYLNPLEVSDVNIGGAKCHSLTIFGEFLKIF